MANDINTCVLVGRLTRDMELKYSNSGLAIGKFAIANNHSKKQGDGYVEQVSFFDCTMFGRYAEALQKYMKKGQQVAAEGVLRQDRWTQDGVNRSKVNIIVNNIELVGGKKESSSTSFSRANGDTYEEESDW